MVKKIKLCKGKAVRQIFPINFDRDPQNGHRPMQQRFKFTFQWEMKKPRSEDQGSKIKYVKAAMRGCLSGARNL